MRILNILHSTVILTALSLVGLSTMANASALLNSSSLLKSVTNQSSIIKTHGGRHYRYDPKYRCDSWRIKCRNAWNNDTNAYRRCLA